MSTTIPKQVADALRGMAWVMVAPCGCVAAAVSASIAPTRDLADAEFREMGSDSHGWPIEFTTTPPLWGCSHSPQWTEIGT